MMEMHFARNADDATRTPGAPWFEDLAVGATITSAPALTITAGHAATHQALLGDRLRLPLDASLAARTLGTEQPVAHPGLVCDIAIGQSTVITQRVIANLFYRGLVLLRPVLIGDTLRTVTRVDALRQNRRRPGRPATGLAVLHVRTTNQHDDPVLDFRRCAMLPLQDDNADTGHRAASEAPSEELDRSVLEASAGAWRPRAFREALGDRRASPAPPTVGTPRAVPGGDVVDGAPELARLTLNVASAHHDAAAAGGRRLVYGGHTIGIAGSQLSRIHPDLVTILAWEGCDHLGPVHEGDTLHSTVETTGATPLAAGGTLLRLRSRVTAIAPGASGPRRDVLDWRLVALAD